MLGHVIFRGYGSTVNELLDVELVSVDELPSVLVDQSVSEAVLSVWERETLVEVVC
jgi:hypothetical protein